jgi:hypothetical protein
VSRALSYMRVPAAIRSPLTSSAPPPFSLLFLAFLNVAGGLCLLLVSLIWASRLLAVELFIAGVSSFVLSRDLFRLHRRAQLTWALRCCGFCFFGLAFNCGSALLLCSGGLALLFCRPSRLAFDLCQRALEAVPHGEDGFERFMREFREQNERLVASPRRLLRIDLHPGVSGALSGSVADTSAIPREPISALDQTLNRVEL